MHLTTPRLQIRPFQLADLEPVVRLMDDCFEAAPRSSRQDWLEWTVRNYTALADLHQPPYGDYAIVLRTSNELVGSIGLVPSYAPFAKIPAFQSLSPQQPTNLFTPELGLFWAIRADHRKHGYATEAANAVTHFAFTTLNAHRLVATTEHTNKASIAVMRKINMTIHRNADPTPAWFQAVGLLLNPRAGLSTTL